MFCVLVVFLYAWFKPLAYTNGNTLQVLVHLCLTAVYLDRIIDGCSSSAGLHDQAVSVRGRTMLEPVMMAMKYIPLAVAAADLLRVDKLLRRVGAALSTRLSRCGRSEQAEHRHHRSIAATKAAEQHLKETLRRAKR